MRNYLIALSALAVVVGTPLAAQDLKIPYSDLDLQTAKGQKALDRRIAQAAREYCETQTTITGSRIVSQAARDCYQNTLAAAREQVAAMQSKGQLGG